MFWSIGGCSLQTPPSSMNALLCPPTTCPGALPWCPPTTCPTRSCFLFLGTGWATGVHACHPLSSSVRSSTAPLPAASAASAAACQWHRAAQALVNSTSIALPTFVRSRPHAFHRAPLEPTYVALLGHWTAQHSLRPAFQVWRFGCERAGAPGAAAPGVVWLLCQGCGCANGIGHAG
jgi:hypothetical protein